jgi:hypothetical protein
MAPLTQKERAASRRRELLDNVQQQIRNGTLVVRQMTPEERARWARSSGGRRASRPR